MCFSEKDWLESLVSAGYDVVARNVVWFFNLIGEPATDSTWKVALALERPPSATVVETLKEELEHFFPVIGAKLYWNEDCLLVLYLASWASPEEEVRFRCWPFFASLEQFRLGRRRHSLRSLSRFARNAGCHTTAARVMHGLLGWEVRLTLEPLCFLCRVCNAHVRV